MPSKDAPYSEWAAWRKAQKGKKAETAEEAFQRVHAEYVQGRASAEELEAAGRLVDDEPEEVTAESILAEFPEFTDDRPIGSDRPHSSDGHTHRESIPAIVVDSKASNEAMATQDPMTAHESAKSRAEAAKANMAKVESFYGRMSPEYEAAFEEVRAAFGDPMVNRHTATSLSEQAKRGAEELLTAKRRATLAEEVQRDWDRERRQLASAVTRAGTPEEQRAALDVLIAHDARSKDESALNAEVAERIKPTRQAQVVVTDDGSVSHTYFADKAGEETELEQKLRAGLEAIRKGQ